jgi:hypothetical protein
VRSARFLNNFHQVRSKLKYWKLNNSNVFGSQKTKEIAKITLDFLPEISLISAMTDEPVFTMCICFSGLYLIWIGLLAKL